MISRFDSALGVPPTPRWLIDRVFLFRHTAVCRDARTDRVVTVEENVINDEKLGVRASAR